MADGTTTDSGDASNQLIFWVLGAAVVLAGAGFIYYKFGMVTSQTEDKAKANGGSDDNKPVATEPKSKPSSGETPVPSQPVSSTSTAKDYTGLSDSKAAGLGSTATNKGFSLGQDVSVAGGTVVTRLDEGLSGKGETKLTADTNLGKIWALNPGSVIIRAKDSFSYPFYKTTYEGLNHQGGTLSKISALLGFAEGEAGFEHINADGFGKE